jgi:hypothetical protein
MDADEALVDVLVKLGCSSERADQVIAKAIERGDDVAELREQIALWRAYCLSERGKSIRAVGYFIAAKIEQSQPAPDLSPSRADTALLWQADIRRYRTARETAVAYTTTRTRPPLAIQWQTIESRLKVLYDLQDVWIDQQCAIDTAACFCRDSGLRVERTPWSWSDSPHAPEIARLETMLEAAHV